MKMIPYLLFLCFGYLTFANQDTPKTHVEKGCKCVDCPYFQAGQRTGLWKVKTETKLYASPISKNVVATLKVGEKVVAVGGEVHEKPGQLTVIHPRKKYKVGDTVYIIHEDAEAGYKVWHEGVEDIEDLFIMVSEKERCKKPTEKCWAKVKEQLTSTWWVEILFKKNQKGWSKEIDNFDFDRSACL